MISTADSSTPSITIITVSYNSAEKFREFWSKVPNDIRWLVVDNNSSDDSVLAAESLGAEVMRSKVNRGFGAANNWAIEAATSQVIAIVNPDVRVEYDELRSMARYVADRRSIVAPQLMNINGSDQPNGRGVPSMQNKVLNRIRPEIAARRGFHRIAHGAEVITPYWITGAVMIAATQTFRELKGFDERFFLYYEDLDMCIRARQAGIGLELHGATRWTHGWARDTVGFNLRGWQREIASVSRFYAKHPQLFFGMVRDDRRNG